MHEKSIHTDLTPTASRTTLKGVSAIVALTLALNAALGALCDAVAMAPTSREAIVGRYVVQAVVHRLERARRQCREIPAAEAAALMDVRPDVKRDVKGREVVRELHATHLDRVALAQLDLPPPARC